MDMNAWVKLKYGPRIDPATEPGVLSADDAAVYRPLPIERLARRAGAVASHHAAPRTAALAQAPPVGRGALAPSNDGGRYAVVRGSFLSGVFSG
jgi:hypothetical protein